MRSRHRHARRRGAISAEAALILPIFLTIVLVVLDLGVGVFRFNTISHAARNGARQAVVHGELVKPSWNGGRWRPSGGGPIDEVCTSSTPAVAAVRPMLVNCPPSETYVMYEWLDGNDEIGSRVRCTVRSRYTPLLTVVLGGSPITLTASSTMPIAH